MNNNKEEVVSADQQKPPTAEEVQAGVQNEEEKKKKRGCLFGCLGAVLIFLVIVIGLGIWGFRNRHKALPFVASRMGTKIEKGLPSGYSGEAYELKLPEEQGNLKVSMSKNTASRANEDFLDYYKSEGWTVSREINEVPAELDTMAAFGEVQGSITILEKEGRGMVIAAMGHDDNSTVLLLEVEDIGELRDR